MKTAQSKSKRARGRRSPAVRAREVKVRTAPAAGSETKRPVEVEKLWFQAFEGAGDGVWDWNIAKGKVVFSAQWKAMLGFRPEEIGGGFNEWKRRLHPDDLPAVMARVVEHFEGRSPVYFNEFRMRCKDGSWKWVQAKGVIMERDPAGRPARMIGIHTDISKGKAASERALRNLALVAEGAPMKQALDAIVAGVEAEHPGLHGVVMLVDEPGGFLVRASSPGLPRKARAAIERIPLGSTASCCGAAVASGKRVLMDGLHPPRERAGGRKAATALDLPPCWAEPIRGSTGRVLGAFVIHAQRCHVPALAEITSVTSAAHLVAMAVERVQREQSLRESEERYRRMVLTAEEGVWTIDASGVTDFVNPKMARMLGYRMEQMVGRSLFDFMDAEGRRICSRNLDRRKKGIAEQHEFKLLHKDGSEVWTLMATSPIQKADGSYGGALAMVTDITEIKRSAQALRASEERLRQALRSAKQGMWDLDLRTGDAIVSPEYATMLGHDPASFVETNARWIERLHPDDHERVSRCFRDYAAGKAKEYAVEFRQRTADGGWKWILSIGEATERDAKGRPLRMTGTHTDITALKEHEERLRQSEERYRFLADNSDDVVALNDTSGRRLYLSPSYYRKTGWTDRELAAADWRTRIHPEDIAIVERARNANLRGEATRIEHRAQCRDGSWVWFETHCKPILGADGKPWRLLVTSHDISERKLAEANYQREVDFNRVLLAHTAAMIIVLDEQGRVLHVNQAVVRAFGLDRDEVIGKTPWSLGIMAHDDGLRAKERYGKLLLGEDVEPYEVRVRDAAGQWHILQVHSSCTRKANGGVDRIIVTALDVTERNRLQREILNISEQEHANIGNDLHDGVGQTLTGVSTLMESLEYELAGPQRESAGRIRKLLQDAILEVRRMSHGLSPSGVKNRGLGGSLQLLAETVRTNHRTACDCEIDSTIRLEDAEKETHLYRIAQESVNNALRHGRPRKIRLSLKRDGAEEGVLRIENDGAALTKPAPSRAEGIGLRVMDYRANLIGGTLHVANRMRGGVRVTCRFPCKPATAGAEAPDEPAERPARAGRRKNGG